MFEHLQDEHTTDSQLIPLQFTPLFEARWAYDEFVRLMPLGAVSEGQAYAHSSSARVAGKALTGSFQMTQYPRVRADGTLLPDAHSLIQTDTGEQVITRAAGFVRRVANASNHWTIIHWMRFWTGTPELAWLNATVAFGVGAMVDDEALVRYFAAAPTCEPSEAVAGAPVLELLGTAHWEYPEYAAVRPFGDIEGVGFATSVGEVDGAVLAGTWHGWHYPTYLRNGLYQLDAHVEIRGTTGIVLNRHGGLATRPVRASDELLYDVVQHATFVAENPQLAYLNDTLAVGVGFVHAPGRVTLSYYGLSVPQG